MVPPFRESGEETTATSASTPGSASAASCSETSATTRTLSVRWIVSIGRAPSPWSRCPERTLRSVTTPSNAATSRVCEAACRAFSRASSAISSRALAVATAASPSPTLLCLTSRVALALSMAAVVPLQALPGAAHRGEDLLLIERLDGARHPLRAAHAAGLRLHHLHGHRGRLLPGFVLPVGVRFRALLAGRRAGAEGVARGEA